MIRAMLNTDGPRVLAIYGQGVRSNLATFTASIPSFEEWDKNHAPDCRLVFEESGAVLGFAALIRHRGAPAYRGVAELSLYVDASARGRGIGRALLSALIDASEKAGYWTLESVITADNAPSIALHRALCFRLVGRRERVSFTPDGLWHDTLIFERRSQRVRADEPYSAPRADVSMTLLPLSFCVLKLPEGATLDVPGVFFSAQTEDERSLVCEERFAPQDALCAEKGFCALKINGPLDFSLVGVLAGVTGVLAAENISVFAVSTFDTDYVLVRETALEPALAALRRAGYRINGEGKTE